MTVYVDLLFVVNFMINTLLLAGATALAGERLARARLLLAAVMGALYSVLIFFPALSPLYAWGLRLTTGAVMVWVGVPTHGVLRYLRALLYFYLTLGLYGGGMYLFYTFTAAGARMLCSNGVYYIDLPLWLLLGLSFAFYGLIRLAALLGQKKHPVDGVVEIEVAIGGCFRNVRALIDTGNSLQDPITLAPVIIVEAQMLQDCLPEELLQAVRRRDSGALEQLAGQYPRLRCRLLPYRGLQGEGHLLFALRPEWIRRLPDGKPVEQVLLGLTASPLCADGSYHALLHNHII